MFVNRSDCEFIDNGEAPVFHADGLHEVELSGSDCWFLLFQYRRNAGGVLFREPAFWARLPTIAVGPAIALTLHKTAGSVVVPTIRTIAEGFGMQ